MENLDPMFYASLVSAYPSGYLRAREIDGEAADEGGSLGDRHWFDGRGLKEYPDWVTKTVRFWDLAATEAKILRGKKMNDPDETVGTLLGTDPEKDIATKRFVIGDQFGGYWDWAKIKEMVVEVAKDDIAKYGNIHIFFEQEPASGGKNQVAELKQWIKDELRKRFGITTNYSVDSLEAKKLGDRVLAANTWFAEAQTVEKDGVVHLGQFYYVTAPWNEKFFSQLDTFNGIRHDDRITSVTGARYAISPIIKKWSSMKFMSVSSKS
jgi:phage terminase large subunit-like protein